MVGSVTASCVPPTINGGPPIDFSRRCKMTQQQNTNPDPAAFLRSALKNQYHAMLSMLRNTIETCPDDLWVSKEFTNPYWRIVYHTLYFLHLYLYTSSRKSPIFAPGSIIRPSFRTWTISPRRRSFRSW
jgi:hypothetical protein